MAETSDHLSADPFAELVGCDVMDLIFEVAPRKVRSRIGKALDHYTKALRLVGVDDEMGAIRLIAAEEELVVAIFELLKLNVKVMPEHSDFIGRSKNHRVKLAFYPVLSQFRFVLGDMITKGISLDGFENMHHWRVVPVRVEDRISLRISDDDGNEIFTHNPLAIFVSQDDRPDQEVINALFEDLKENIRSQLNMSLREFVTARAEYRNKLLYAEDAGYLEMEESLDVMIEAIFKTTLRDLLWALAALLTNKPAHADWGIVSQFVSLYRKVLVESKVI